MADSAVALLDAGKRLLTGTAEISGLVGDRVYAAVPVNPNYPYILLTCESQPFSADDFSGMEHRLRVQAFARENKPATVLALRAAAFDALNRNEKNLALDGHDLVLIEHEGVSTYFPEPDGKTFQSLIEFKVLVN